MMSATASGLFQFLIGNLESLTMKKEGESMNLVSIPYR